MYAERLNELNGRDPLKETEPSTGPSFDCSRARTEDEIAICANKELAQMDAEVSSLYRDKVRGLGRIGLQSAKAIQRSWLRARSDCGGDEACLKSVYRRRLDQLGSR